MEIKVEPEFLLGVRLGTGKKLRSLDVLIQWKGLPPLEASWEPYHQILHQFLEFHLEDKVSLIS